MVRGLESEIAMLMRPFMVSGKPPPFTSLHVFPASVDFHSAEPGPPELRKYGPRTRCQLDAQTVFGFDGSSATSTKPALSEMNLISCQVWPPSQSYTARVPDSRST